jgi:two-component system, cell cycle response regulator
MTDTAHVLIIDDDRVMAQASALQIRALGWEATTCHTWTEALEAFTRIDVDLVLMDAVMPGLDGFRLTKLLRERAKRYVPIVFLTTLSDGITRQRCEESGADDLLTKPADPLELRFRLGSMLRIRGLTRELERQHEALQRLAYIDGLTGIGNRRAFDERLAEEVERHRAGGTPTSLLLLDIDHFKRVNDDHGHQLGDELLSALGAILRSGTRGRDVPFRYGGEEFAVISCGTPSHEAVLVAERIRNTFASITQMAACGEQTVSIGVSGVDQLDGARAEDLVTAADAALYRAKNDGRDRVRIHRRSVRRTLRVA